MTFHQHHNGAETSLVVPDPAFNEWACKHAKPITLGQSSENFQDGSGQLYWHLSSKIIGKTYSIERKAADSRRVIGSAIQLREPGGLDWS